MGLVSATPLRNLSPVATCDSAPFLDRANHTHKLTHSLSLTQVHPALSHSPTHSASLKFAQHSVTHPLTHSLTHHSPTHSLAHPLTHSLTNRVGRVLVDSNLNVSREVLIIIQHSTQSQRLSLDLLTAGVPECVSQSPCTQLRLRCPHLPRQQVGRVIGGVV